MESETRIERVRSGAPVNTKSLLAFIFCQMERLNAGEIDAQTAMAQAKLASQANNVLDYELKRTLVQMKLREIGAALPSDVRLRDVESKTFDDAKSE